MDFEASILFNFAGWKKTFLYIGCFGIVYITDVLCTTFCFTYLTHDTILGVATLFYTIMIWISAKIYGIDRRTSNLIFLVKFIIIVILMAFYLIPLLGLT